MMLENLPKISTRNIAMHVKPAAERAIRNGHPWLFEDGIRKQSKAGQPGDIAVIYSKRDKFLAVGLYDPDSPIRVKILHQGGPARINSEFFREKLQNAFKRRESIPKTDTTGYRLLYGEGDGLPGFILDRYADVLVLKLYTAAWLPHLNSILPELNTLLPDKSIVLRLSRALQQGASSGLYDGMILQGQLPENSVQFREYGLIFQADVIDGHKTGFFFDQRENRRRVRDLSNNKTVLDVFSYNGGFSVNAAAGGAKSVLSLDISAAALQSARENMQLNTTIAAVEHCQHEILVADAFEGLQELAQKPEKFEMLIVDPPTFAGKQAQVAGAMQAYARLVRLSLSLLAPGGTFVMASCSSRVPADDFYRLIHETATNHGRPLHEIARTQHAIDHPVPEAFPEGAYLKCLFSTVP